MYLVEFKSNLHRVSEVFFKTKRSLSKEEFKKQIMRFPIHSTSRVISDKEFAELELKNWHR